MKIQNHTKIYLVIIAVLGLVLMNFSEDWLSPPINTKMAETRQTLRVVLRVLENYRKDFGKLPSEVNGLEVLINKSFEGRYLLDEKELYDNWGNRLVYHYSCYDGEEHFQLYSVGMNGIDEKMKGDDLFIVMP